MTANQAQQKDAGGSSLSNPHQGPGASVGMKGKVIALTEERRAQRNPKTKSSKE